MLQIVTAQEQEEAVLEILQRTGPCCLDDLVRYLPYLSWSEVFLAIDRMSKDGRLLSSRSPSRQEEVAQP
jgi:hypothetical protein